MKHQLDLNLRRITCLTVMLLAVLLCTVVAATDPPASREDAKAQTEEPKVAYMEEIWKPLGPDHNILLKDRTWKVLDNAGKVVFTKPTRMLDDYPLDQIGYAGDSLYVRSLYHEPTKLEVAILNADGSEAHRLETQPLMHTHIVRSLGLVFAHGSDVFAEGRQVQANSIVAYVAGTGQPAGGELPSYQSAIIRILSQPQWNSLFLVTAGDLRSPDAVPTLLQFDKTLKNVFSAPIAVKGQRLEFACTAKDAIHAVVTTPDHKWTFVHFDVKAGKLSFPAFDVPKSFWLRGLVSGDNVVVWGGRGRPPRCSRGRRTRDTASSTPRASVPRPPSPARAGTRPGAPARNRPPRRRNQTRSRRARSSPWAKRSLPAGRTRGKPPAVAFTTGARRTQRNAH